MSSESNVENLVLEHLKAIRSDQDTIKAELQDIKYRLGSLERTALGLHENYVHSSLRLDRMSEKLGRIEKRLDLVDA